MLFRYWVSIRCCERNCIEETAAYGSSLGRVTSLPLESCSCSWELRPRFVCSPRSALSDNIRFVTRLPIMTSSLHRSTVDQGVQHLVHGRDHPCGCLVSALVHQ